MSYGELVPGVDCDRLLRALASVETGGGRNNWPRVEASYIPGGLTFTCQGRLISGTGKNVNSIVASRWQKWGLATAASWGWWQILYHTAADLGFSGPPQELMDSGTCEPYVVARLRKLADAGCSSVRDFADGWNSGNWRDANRVKEYTDLVEAAYGKDAGAAAPSDFDARLRSFLSGGAA